MADMHETLAKWGTSAFVNSGPTVTLREVDKRLCDACRNGDLEGVRKALNDGADPGVQFRLALGEVTPIFLCAQKGRQDIARVLIEKGADVRRKMEFDQTICLHHAASNAQPEMCRFLIEQKCNVDARDKLGRTPLMDAAEIGCTEAVKVLVDHHADVVAVDNEGHSALSYCIDFVSTHEPRFYDCANLLVESGASVNDRGKFANRTLLHCAAAQGDLKTVTSLIEEKQAYVVVFDSEQMRPEDYARHNKHTQVEEYLQVKAAEEQRSCCVIL